MTIDKKLMHRIFLLIAGGIAFGWLLLDTDRVKAVFVGIWQLLSPFVLGAGIAFIFNVPMRIIENQLDGMKRAGLRRNLAMALTILFLVLIIMFVFELLIPQIRLTVASLSERIPGFIERTSNSLMKLMEENPELGAWIQEQLDLESLDWKTLLKDALTLLGTRINQAIGGAVNVIGNVAGAIIDIVVAIVFAMYCLSRKEILARQGRRILYSLLPEHWADETVRVLRLTNSTFSNFISGQCLEACILGCLFAVSMALFKMPYISLVSVIIALTALIPVVGAFVGCILGAFFILVNNPIQAVAFVALFLVLQQIEGNLIYPRVVGTSVGLPGMWVLVAVTVGGDLMGIGGMLIMIPLASVLYTLAREFTNKRLTERGIPEEKLQDQPPDIKSQYQRTKERKERVRLQKMKQKLQAFQEQQKKK